MQLYLLRSKGAGIKYPSPLGLAYSTAPYSRLYLRFQPRGGVSVVLETS